MSSPASSSSSAPSTPSVVLPLIYEYLCNLKHSSPSQLSGEGVAESLEIILDTMKELGQTNNIDMKANSQDNETTAATHAFPLDVLLRAGSSSLSSSVSPVSFYSFLNLLSEKGYFTGCKEGSTEYQQRTYAAKIKFLEKYLPAATGTSSSSSSSKSSSSSSSPPSASSLSRAEEFKSAGNACLSSGDYHGAVSKYSSAIELNPSSAIYYSNRAAAYINLTQYHNAINDCTAAIAVDSAYNKAHYRLGQAHAALKQWDEAIKAFNQALDLSKTDQNISTQIKQQLKEAKKQKRIESGEMGTFDEQQEGQGGETENEAQSSSGGGGMDFSSLMNNPALAGLFGGGGGSGGLDFGAMMKDPNIMNMAQSMFGGNGGGAPASAPAASSPPVSSPPPSSSRSSAAPPDFNSKMASFLSSPAGSALSSDPEIMAALDDMKENGQGAMMKYLSKPSIMQKLAGLLKYMQ